MLVQASSCSVNHMYPCQFYFFKIMHPNTIPLQLRRTAQDLTFSAKQNIFLDPDSRKNQVSDPTMRTDCTQGFFKTLGVVTWLSITHINNSLTHFQFDTFVFLATYSCCSWSTRLVLIACT